MDLVPQGTLAEQHPQRRERASAASSPRRASAPWSADGKQVIVVDGEEYLLETALRADIALRGGTQRGLQRQPRLFADGAEFQSADGAGRRLRRSPKPTKSCPLGVLAPDAIHTPGRPRRPSGRTPHTGLTQMIAARDLIARRIALELRDNTLVNLGHRDADAGGKSRAQAGMSVSFPIRERHHRVRPTSAGGYGRRASDRCGRRFRLGPAGRGRLRFRDCPSRSSAAAISI